MLCPHSRSCPGCPLIEREYPAQLEHKRAVVARAIARYGVLADPEVAPTAPADPVTNFRVRAKLVSDGRSLGLFARGSHRVVDIPECRIQRPRLHAVIAALRADLKALGAVSAFDLREADAGVLVTAAVDPGLAPAERRRLAERIAALDANVVSVAVSTRARDAPQVLGTDASVLVGPSELEHRPDPDAPFHYAAHGAFTQAHAGQLARLHAAIEDTLAPLAKRQRPGTKSRVLELYAGSGGLSLRLASRGFAVTLVETFAPAVRMAERAAKAQDLTLVALAADTASALATFAGTGSRFDVVIANPPRRGLSPEVRKLVAELGPAHVVYISCDPETFARDAAHLAVVGYGLRRATPFDMIPLSEAVETLALFEPAPPPAPRVLGEGASFLAVDKPPHEPTGAEPGERSSLLARVRSLPGAQHAVALDALDTEASGVCLFARTPADVPALERALEHATSEAWGLVRGVIRAQGRLPAARKLGAEARYERREVLGSASLLVVQTPPAAALEARRAFAKFGHPLLGDARHGDRRANVYFGLRHALERPFWHRRALTLALGGVPQRLESPLAPDLEAVLASLREVKA